MNALEQKKKTFLAAWAVLLLTLAALTGMISGSAAAAAGIRSGLTVCGELLIPSVYPMMIFGALLIRSGAADQIGRLLAPVTHALFRLPGCAGTVFLTAMLGGYPVGARGVRTLLEQGAITRPQAERMMLFCVGAGPGFVVVTVGRSLFGSSGIGALLLCCQIVTAILLGVLSRFTARGENTKEEPPPIRGAPSFADALTGAVTDASSGVLTLCAFVIAFSALQAMLELLPVFRQPGWTLSLRLLLEVTGGVCAARSAGSPVLAAFALGWGGLCVQGQVSALSGVHNRFFLPFRFLHGVLSAGLTALMQTVLPAPHPVILPVSGLPQAAASAANGGFSAALLGLIAVFLFSLPGNCDGESEATQKKTQKVHKKHSAVPQSML